MKNKGFTLIELLAVIIILAIILIIAIPKILNIIESSRNSSWNSTVKIVEKAIEDNSRIIDIPSTTTKTSPKQLCNNETTTEINVTNRFNGLVKLDGLNITCKKDTNYIFTLVGKDQFAGKEAVINCANEGTCNITSITNNGTPIDNNSSSSSNTSQNNDGTYVYDFPGAETLGNGGSTEWVNELDPNQKMYLRNDGSKIEICEVYPSGTVCFTGGDYESDFEDVTENASNITTIARLEATGLKGYVLAKTKEMLNKGASSCDVNNFYGNYYIDCYVPNDAGYCIGDVMYCDDGSRHWYVRTDGFTSQHPAP